MTGTLIVFVDGQAVTVAGGATALDAVDGADGILAARIRAGTAYITDGRGIELDPGSPLESGAILRIVMPARRDLGQGLADQDDDDADA